MRFSGQLLLMNFRTIIVVVRTIVIITVYRTIRNISRNILSTVDSLAVGNSKFEVNISPGAEFIAYF